MRIGQNGRLTLVIKAFETTAVITVKGLAFKSNSVLVYKVYTIKEQCCECPCVCRA